MAISAVKKIAKVTSLRSGLARMIDEAGELNAQSRAYADAYNELRGKIALRMPMDDAGNPVCEVGEEYQAKHFYPDKKFIDPEKLFKYDRNLFWRLVKVSVGDAEKTLPASDFHKLVEFDKTTAPQLTISKLKPKKAA